MKKSSNKSMNNIDLVLNKELKYSNNQYNFKNVLSIPLILDQINKFLKKDDIRCLSLCSKEIYQLYCNQISKLKIKEDIEISKVLNIKFDKYKNLIELDLSECRYIKDYSFISKLEKLENLNLSYTNISDISFLEQNKNIKEIDLSGCKNIKDYSFISKLEKLENLFLSDSNISDISFLEQNKNIKVLDLSGCENIKDYSFISKLEKLENLNLCNTNISDISFLEEKKILKY